MTTRHGISSTLRLLRRLPPSSVPHGRGFSASRRNLKEHDRRRNDISLKDTNYDYRQPCSAARPNFPNHIRHLMRSAPNHLTAVISSSSPEQYRDIPTPALHNKHLKPAPAIEKHDGMSPLPKLTGLLVSSFNTVALYPKPYVSFNIRLPSLTYDVIRASNEFTASGLKDARVADALVKRGFALRDRRSEKFWAEWVGGENNDGRLAKGKGGTWWMRCRLQGDKCVEVGDHMIVVAEVLECGGYEDGEGMGLVYAEGGYRKVGEVVDLREGKEGD